MWLWRVALASVWCVCVCCAQGLGSLHFVAGASASVAGISRILSSNDDETFPAIPEVALTSSKPCPYELSRCSTPFGRSSSEFCWFA